LALRVFASVTIVGRRAAVPISVLNRGFSHGAACRYVMRIAHAGKTLPEPKELPLDADMTSVANGRMGCATVSITPYEFTRR
jgi:hypothetical protein